MEIAEILFDSRLLLMVHKDHCIEIHQKDAYAEFCNVHNVLM